ncbi:hypothetical protein a10_02801 [Streptomyces acidiscabies]|nr:hypothetical protein a10_02801 [Streptomyces acidiscabies]
MHLVPRWHGDVFGPLWPVRSQRPTQQDERVVELIGAETAYEVERHSGPVNSLEEYEG